MEAEITRRESGNDKWMDRRQRQTMRERLGVIGEFEMPAKAFLDWRLGRGGQKGKIGGLVKERWRTEEKRLRRNMRMSKKKGDE